MIEKNYAFVTVLTTDDYLIGVLSLNESLKRVNSKYPFIVVVNNKKQEVHLKKLYNYVMMKDCIQKYSPMDIIMNL